MGEIKTWTDKAEYIAVLKKEIQVLESRHNPDQGGTGHINTAIGVLRNRVDELELDSMWPFPNATTA
jgi:hypothetical protein